MQITNDYKKTELELIAPNPDCQSLTYVPDFTDLIDTKQLIDEKICSSKRHSILWLLNCNGSQTTLIAASLYSNIYMYSYLQNVDIIQ